MMRLNNFLNRRNRANAIINRRNVLISRSKIFKELVIVSLLAKEFSTSNYLLVENDEDKFLERIQKQLDDYRDVEDRVEDLVNEVVKEEENYQDSEDEEETELSKEVKRMESDKDDYIGDMEKCRDHSLFSNKDIREDRALLLEYINEAGEKDIELLQHIQSELAPSDPLCEAASELEKDVQKEIDSSEELYYQWRKYELNHIHPSYNDQNDADSYPKPPVFEVGDFKSEDTSKQSDDTSKKSDDTSNKSFPQDSSDVHQTDFTCFDDLGGD